MLSTLKWFNVGLRVLMELGIVVALGYWGYQTGEGAGMKVLLGIGAPLIGFGVWGLVDFRKAGSFAEPLRLIQELVISGLAAFALYVVEAKGFALALAFASLLHHILVYVSGETLLKKSSVGKGV
jgi:hypothetical protein